MATSRIHLSDHPFQGSFFYYMDNPWLHPGLLLNVAPTGAAKGGRCENQKRQRVFTRAALRDGLTNARSPFS